MFDTGFPQDWSTIKKLIWLKGTALANKLVTITGSIVSFLASKSKAINKIEVAIEPQQDLHGQNAPYPAGGSNNLIPDGTDTSNGYVDSYAVYADGSLASASNWYTCEYFRVSEGETYTWSSKVEGYEGGLCFYDENKSYISGVSGDSSLPKTVTAPAGAVYCRTSQGKDFSLRGTQVELGSTATTIKPYSNVCPITGYTGCNIKQTGENCFDSSTVQWKTGHRLDTDGSEVSSTYMRYSLNYFELKPSTLYTVSLYKVTSNNTSCNVCVYDEDQVFIERYTIFNATTSTGNKSGTFTSPSNAKYFRISVPYSSTAGSKGSRDIEVSERNTRSISWQTEAGTVYGGTLTINQDGSVDLVSEFVKTTITSVTQVGSGYAMKKIGSRGTFSWSSSACCNILNLWSGSVSSLPYGYFATVNSSAFNRDQICFKIKGVGMSASAYDTYLENLNTSGTPMEVVWKLKTPATYHLDSIEALYTLVGENNIWADTNGTISVTASGITEITPSDAESLNLLLGGRYVNNHTPDDVSDSEALNIILGGER